MKRNKIITFCAANAIIQFAARTKSAGIFFCTSEEKEYTEHVFEETVVKNEELYQSGSFLEAAGRYAAEEWKKRHICLPSLMTAILLLETDNGRKVGGDIRELVKTRTDYLAARKTEEGQEENWKSLWGQENYVLAVQYLQTAARPYFKDKNYEKLLIETIEKNRLTRFDFPCLNKKNSKIG